MGSLGGFRKGLNRRGCEKPARLKANGALGQTVSENVPVARRPKNLRIVNVAVCTA